MKNAGPPTRRKTPPRTGLLLPAGVALLAGLDAALLLLGVPAPVSTDRLPEVHGMLMAIGFVGTLVCLERSVALGRPAGYLAPALLGVGSLLLLSPAPLVAGRAVLLAGMVAMCGVYVPLWRRQRDDAVLVQALGAVLGAGATTLWMGGLDVASMIPWLAGFLVLTIAGERLELARLALGPQAGPTLVVLSTALMAGAVASLLWPAVGYPLTGLALVALTSWLLVHDVARRTVRAPGLTRFMAASMLAGWAWLLVAGAIWVVHAGVPTGAAYDAVIHATFLGFTISMVIAHAPVILPSVVRRPLPYRPVLWVPLGLLHVSLAVRLWLGDALGIRPAWQLGGVLNVVALLLFVTLAAWSVATAGRGRLAVPHGRAA
ncbi:MAG TPA: hypothetical protein VFM09_10935 [Marmoricola sp.]|nr:hypothetical protein [Marmoricola sp.]